MLSFSKPHVIPNTAGTIAIQVFQNSALRDDFNERLVEQAEIVAMGGVGWTYADYVKTVSVFELTATPITITDGTGYKWLPQIKAGPSDHLSKHYVLCSYGSGYAQDSAKACLLFCLNDLSRFIDNGFSEIKTEVNLSSLTN